MMQAIKHMSRRRVATEPEPEPLETWYILCATSSTNPQWGFDRFRIDGGVEGIELGVVVGDTTNFTTEYTEEGIKVTELIPNSVDQVQPFHSGGGWTTDTFEHDFTFDLSIYSTHNDDAKAILIKGLTSQHKIYQVYASPTGYGATRGKNAEIEAWSYRRGKVESSGSQIGRIRFDNQVVAPYELLYPNQGLSIYALEVNIGAGNFYIDTYLKALVDGGLSNGTFTYTGTPSSNGLNDYNTLVNRGWTLNGNPPLP